MAQAYAITQYNGLDYQNGFQPKWNLVSERNDTKSSPQSLQGSKQSHQIHTESKVMRVC